MSIIIDNKQSNILDDNSKWDSDSQKMRKARKWLVDQACDRIVEMCNRHIDKYPQNKIPDEISFNWVNVRNDLMRYLGILSNDKTSNVSLPIDYSFDTIYQGGFGTPSGHIDRTRLREAGVINPFVLDVKRAMGQRCVKVWDISDKNVSNKNVWKITIFIHEIKKLKQGQTQ